MTRKATWRSISAAALIAAGVVSLAPGGTASAEETLTLRVNDARAEPGDLVAVVVRTYATRGMAQGEICLMASSGPDSAAIGAPALKGLRSKTMPFVALEAVEVASVAGDVTSLAAFDEPSQMALVRFSSPSGTVNESDGPLATFYFRVSENFAGPAEFLIAIDLGGTFLVEVVFDWPGMGNYAAGSLTSLDFPAILGVTVLFAAVRGVVNIVVDLLYYALDPRVATEGMA